MKKLKLSRLSAIASLALCSYSVLLTASISAKAQESKHPVTIAQLFYPPAENSKLVRVIGQGTVRRPADRAEIKILVNIQDTFDDSAPFDNNLIPENPPSSQETNAQLISTQLAQLPQTESDLAPLVNALINSGISREDISAKIPKPRPNRSPFPFPSPSFGQPDAAFVLVKVNNPTKDAIESVVLTAENHLASSNRLRANDIKVSYQIKQCEQIQLRAFQNAVLDAQKRAAAIAQAMNATLSPAASVAEPFFNLFAPGCESGQGLPLSGKKYNSYEPNDPIEVVVDRIIFSTYTLE